MATAPLVDEVRLRCLDGEELAALVATAGLRLVEVVEEPPRLLAVAAPGERAAVLDGGPRPP